MRLTEKIFINNKFCGYGFKRNHQERVVNRTDSCDTTNTTEIIQKLGQLEDIEDELKKHTFYGKVWQFPNKLMELRFIEICKGNDYDLDIRIVFEVIGYGNIFYSIFQYGKLFALTKKELE